MSVDLPAPLRPISPMRAPGGMAAEASCRIARPPSRTVSLSMVIIAARPLAGRAEEPNLLSAEALWRAMPRYTPGVVGKRPVHRQAAKASYAP